MRQAITGAAYFVGAVDLSSQSNKISFEVMVAEIDATTFGSGGAQELVGGLESASISAGGPIDLGSAYDVEREKYSNQRGLLPHTISPSNSGSAVAAPAYVVKSLDTSFKTGATVGDLLAWEVSASGSSKTGYGAFLWSPATAITTTVDGTAVEIGAVPSEQYGLAALHVLARSGTATLDVVVESDVDANFDGSETSRITFDQVSGTGSQFGSVVGPITDTFWRAALTVSGSGSLTIALAFGVSLF